MLRKFLDLGSIEPPMAELFADIAICDSLRSHFQQFCDPFACITPPLVLIIL